MRHRQFGAFVLSCACVLAPLTAALLGGSGLAGCDAVRSDTYHQRIRFRAVDESFALTYVAPPWTPTEEHDDSLRLEIAAEVFGASIDDAPPTHILVAGAVDGTVGFDVLLEDLGFGDSVPDPMDIPDIPDIPDVPSIPDIPEGTDIPGVDGELPSYLLDVDLTNYRDVAFAELRYLTEEVGGLVVNGLTTFTTDEGERGVVFQVGIDPGLFVRSFYFDRGSRSTLRIGAASLFQLATTDMDLMVKTVASDVVLNQGGE